MRKAAFILKFGLICICFFMAMSCSKEDEEKEKTGLKSLLFSGNASTLETGKTLPLSLKYVMNGQNAILYDTALNPLDLQWSSSDVSIATVSQQGVVTGMGAGRVQITVSTSDHAIHATTSLLVSSNQVLTALSMSFSDNILFSKGVTLKRNAVMQCFDLDSTNKLYYVQLAGTDSYNLHVISGLPNTAYSDYMTLTFFGHGTNLAIEEMGSARYVWIGCYGTRGSDNSYSGSQTVCRFKYEPGKTLHPADCTEQYYLPGYKNIHPALDVVHDVIAFTTSGGSQTGRSYFIYKLGEVKALPVTQVKLSFSLTYGGGNSPEASVTETPTVAVRDLSKLTPIGQFTMLEGGTNSSVETVGHYSSQGFDVADNQIFYYEGDGNANDGASCSNSYVTVYNFNGRIVKKRTKVAAISDMAALKTYGITTTGYMEAEGMKIHGNNMYLGFASKSSDEVRRAVVLKYPY